MRPAEFAYLRASTIAEALAMLGDADAALPLAGGQALLKQLRSREVTAARIVDVARIAALNFIRVDGRHLEIGATTTLATLLDSAEVKRHCAALRQAAARIGDVQVRNRATAGGNLFNGAASDLGTVLLACRGDVLVRNADGERSIAAADFFGREQSACPPGSLLTALRFGIGSASAFEKLSRRAADPAMVNAAACVWSVEARAVTIAVGAAHTTIVDAAEAAQAYAAKGDRAAVRASLTRWSRTLSPPSTPHAGADYRRAVVPVVALRALDAALAGAGARP